MYIMESRNYGLNILEVHALGIDKCVNLNSNIYHSQYCKHNYLKCLFLALFLVSLLSLLPHVKKKGTKCS